MPNRTEVIERLRELGGHYIGGVAMLESGETIHISATLTQAADLLEAGESHTEYRVVRSDGLPGLAFLASLAEIEAHRNSLEAEHHWRYRIQQRTVAETPWTDVEREADRG